MIPLGFRITVNSIAILQQEFNLAGCIGSLVEQILWIRQSKYLSGSLGRIATNKCETITFYGLLLPVVGGR